MADDTTAKKPPQKGGRDARLAAALRENLRRRKAQERGRDAAGEGAGAENSPIRPRESGDPGAAGR